MGRGDKYEDDAVDARGTAPYGVIDGTDTLKRISVDSEGRLNTIMVSSLVPKIYDYVSCGYTGSNLTTVVYKTGGSGGTTVATLTLAYDGSDNLTSITRT
jgi:hypothetical protein